MKLLLPAETIIVPAYSVESDERSHKVLSHTALHCLPCLLRVDDFTPLAISMVFSSIAALIVTFSNLLVVVTRTFCQQLQRREVASGTEWTTRGVYPGLPGNSG
jgi:hypothetical protein